MVVIELPLVDDPSSFFKAKKQLTVESFIAESAIETFHITVFPWTAFGDVQGFYFSLV